MMDLVEELYKRLAQKICGSMVIPYQGKQIDMGHWVLLGGGDGILVGLPVVEVYAGILLHAFS